MILITEARDNVITYYAEHKSYFEAFKWKAYLEKTCNIGLVVNIRIKTEPKP